MTFTTDWDIKHYSWCFMKEVTDRWNRNQPTQEELGKLKSGKDVVVIDELIGAAFILDSEHESYYKDIWSSQR